MISALQSVLSSRGPVDGATNAKPFKAILASIGVCERMLCVGQRWPLRACVLGVRHDELDEEKVDRDDCKPFVQSIGTSEDT